MIWLIILVLYVCFMCAIANRKLANVEEKAKKAEYKICKPVMQLKQPNINVKYNESVNHATKTDWLFELGQ